MSPYEDAERLMEETEHLRELLKKKQAVVVDALAFVCDVEVALKLRPNPFFSSMTASEARRFIKGEADKLREKIRAMDGEP